MPAEPPYPQPTRLMASTVAPTPAAHLHRPPVLQSHAHAGALLLQAADLRRNVAQICLQVAVRWVAVGSGWAGQKGPNSAGCGSQKRCCPGPPARGSRVGEWALMLVALLASQGEQQKQMKRCDRARGRAHCCRRAHCCCRIFNLATPARAPAHLETSQHLLHLPQDAVALSNLQGTGIG